MALRNTLFGVIESLRSNNNSVAHIKASQNELIVRLYLEADDPRYDEADSDGEEHNLNRTCVEVSLELAKPDRIWIYSIYYFANTGEIIGRLVNTYLETEDSALDQFNKFMFGNYQLPQYLRPFAFRFKIKKYCANHGHTNLPADFPIIKSPEFALEKRKSHVYLCVYPEYECHLFPDFMIIEMDQEFYFAQEIINFHVGHNAYIRMKYSLNDVLYLLAYLEYQFEW